MYIRTREDALEAVAAILELPDRHARLVRSADTVMLCLDAEPRRLVADCEALLIEDGLEALRLKRALWMAAHPLISLDPEGDRFLRTAADGLDALELGGVVRHVFPEIRTERWILARALLRGEGSLRDTLSAAIRARSRLDERARARRLIEAAAFSARPAWIDRAGALRSACLSVIKNAGVENFDVPHEEADLLFAVLALSDELVGSIFADPPSADVRLALLHQALQAVRADRLPPEGPSARAA